VLKSKLAKKKGLTYEELCENIENVLKEIYQKTYQNLIWVVILSLIKKK